MLMTSALRYDATVGDVADGMFELNGGVVNLKSGDQHLPDIAQYALTGGGRNIGNADMAGERVGVGADAPDVQIMHVD